MTKEQEAVKLLKDFSKMDFSNPMGWTGYYNTELKELSQAIETVLNMLKEKDKEIERLEKQSKNLDKQAQQYFEQTIYLDKAIDLMAEVIYKRTNYKELNKYCNKKDKNKCESYTECYNCIKQYFERKNEE